MHGFCSPNEYIGSIHRHVFIVPMGHRPCGLIIVPSLLGGKTCTYGLPLWNAWLIRPPLQGTLGYIIKFAWHENACSKCYMLLYASVSTMDSYISIYIRLCLILFTTRFAFLIVMSLSLVLAKAINDSKICHMLKEHNAKLATMLIVETGLCRQLTMSFELYHSYLPHVGCKWFLYA